LADVYQLTFIAQLANLRFNAKLTPLAQAAMLQSERRSSPSHLNAVCGRPGECVERSVFAQVLPKIVIGLNSM
jgi:hypothetical protein